MSLTDFFLNSSSSIRELEVVEISHSSFSKTYYFVRNAANGVQVNLETGSPVYCEYYPMRLNQLEDRQDLDFGLSVDMGDVNRILKGELELVDNEDAYNEKPAFVYRTYRSDDLTAPLFGPLNLEITSVAFNETGASFEATAPRLNVQATGLLYTLERFPSLRGFL